jgi:hypothetical protein
VNFFPLQNSGFNNDFYERLTLDGKEPAPQNAFAEQRPAKWVACGNVVDDARRAEDSKLAQMYDMLVNTCSHMVVHDCMVVLNPTECPMLGAERTEANPFVYGPGKKLDSAWAKRTFIPILSMCTSAKHADLPVPTADDWESITQQYFASVRRGKAVCRNRYLTQEVAPWGNRTASVAKAEDVSDQTLPVFFWRGVVHGDDHHPRRLLAQASARYATQKMGAALKPGVLDAAVVEGNLLRLSYVAEHNLVLVHSKNKLEKEKEKEKDKDNLTCDPIEQSKKYKFTFNVENIAASYKLGVLFKLGFCVLHVETPYKLWFEGLTDNQGIPLLRGGDVEDYEEGWGYISVKRDLSNLERTVQWCIENDEKCRHVAEHGKRFYAAYFTRQHVYEYLASTLNSVSARQKVVERTVLEEQSYLKELTSAFDSLDAKLPLLKRHVYEVAQPLPLRKSVVLVAFRGKEHLLALQQCLKHLKKCNVVVVDQAEGGFNRGALMNAAYKYIVQHISEVDTFVMIDPEAVFTTDFSQRYFGNDGKDVVDLGKSIDAPLGWAVKCSKEVFKKINGFPNTISKDGAFEAFENRLRVHGVPVHAPVVASAFATSPKVGVENQNQNQSKQKHNENVRAALVMDAMQHMVDGVNTLQYSVTQSKKFTGFPNVRTLTVRLVPEAELEDLSNRLVSSDPESESKESKETKETKETTETNSGSESDGGLNTSKGGSEAPEEPAHLKTIELAYVHEHTMIPHGGSNVVHVLDDDEPPSSETLPFLDNAEVMPTENQSTVKTIEINLK